MTGWHIYPLQLDDLSPISYSSVKTPAALPEDLATAQADISGPVVASAKRLSIPLDEKLLGSGGSGRIGAPTAADVGPIFYRFVTFCLTMSKVLEP